MSSSRTGVLLTYSSLKENAPFMTIYVFLALPNEYNYWELAINRPICVPCRLTLPKGSAIQANAIKSSALCSKQSMSSSQQIKHSGLVSCEVQRFAKVAHVWTVYGYFSIIIIVLVTQCKRKLPDCRTQNIFKIMSGCQTFTKGKIKAYNSWNNFIYI